jgi:hypothetical protein
LTRPMFESVLKQLNEGDFRNAASKTEDLANGMKHEPDLAFHDLFYLRFLYDTQGRDPRYIIEYIRKMETVTAEYPENPDLKRCLGTGYVIYCRELFQKAMDEFRNADEVTNGAEPHRSTFESAGQLGESFFQFIRDLFV